NKLAGNEREMLLILRPAQAGGQFEIGRDIVIGLAERCVGIENVRVLAAKIIVTIAVQAADRIGIDIDAGIDRRLAAAFCGIVIFEAAITREAAAVVGYADHPGTTREFGKVATPA